MFVRITMIFFSRELTNVYLSLNCIGEWFTHEWYYKTKDQSDERQPQRATHTESQNYSRKIMECCASASRQRAVRKSYAPTGTSHLYHLQFVSVAFPPPRRFGATWVWQQVAHLGVGTMVMLPKVSTCMHTSLLSGPNVCSLLTMQIFCRFIRTLMKSLVLCMYNKPIKQDSAGKMSINTPSPTLWTS